VPLLANIDQEMRPESAYRQPGRLTDTSYDRQLNLQPVPCYML